ncbi:MAG: ribonuclease P [Candidatus Nezhaarchaeota archaeon]|nr:ribonuclease P [Candidatus Nezhaarchaeota archaeon]MCX8142114.1 ribonuclease P [Candidatus Nezhaarchaeota archaeon]MDW8050105.1 ribonuclease P [Nitrososphaerota archaeon]
MPCKKQRVKINKIALERIRILFEMADKMFHVDPMLSHRYVMLARRIAMRCRVRIPRDLRRRFCHYCYKFLKLGVNCRVRLAKKREPHIAITCLECGNTMRLNLRGLRFEKRH